MKVSCATPESLSMASLTSVSFPERFRNCLGFLLVESGQSLVPPPPAITTPYTFITISFHSLSVAARKPERISFGLRSSMSCTLGEDGNLS